MIRQRAIYVFKDLYSQPKGGFTLGAVFDAVCDRLGFVHGNHGATPRLRPGEIGRECTETDND